MIVIKRIYEVPEDTDGERILVDRLWSRGISREEAKIDLWLKDLAPSETLRTWFDHDPGRWEEFKKRYTQELKTHKTDIDLIRSKSRAGRVTLLFASKDTEHNNAVVLLDHLTQPSMFQFQKITRIPRYFLLI